MQMLNITDPKIVATPRSVKEYNVRTKTKD